MNPNLVHKDQIKKIIEGLESDLTYLSFLYGDDDLFSRGYGKAVESTISHLQKLLPVEPKHGEAWEIQLRFKDGSTKTTIAIRNSEGEYWEDLDNCYLDSEPAYQVTLKARLTPEEKK